MEPRAFYDVTAEEDRAEVAQFIKAGVFNYALLMPEDFPRGDLEDVFKRAGFAQVEVDASQWPRRVVVKTERGAFRLEKVEEGVYKIAKENTF